MLQWNVLWGGGLGYRGPEAPQRAAITDRAPDLVVLSEAPSRRMARPAPARRTRCRGRLRGTPAGSRELALLPPGGLLAMAGPRRGASSVARRVGDERRGRGSGPATLRLMVVDGISSPHAVPHARSFRPSRRRVETPRRQDGRSTWSSATSTRPAGASDSTNSPPSAIAWRADRREAGAGRSRRGSPSSTSTTSGCAEACDLGSCAFFNGLEHRPPRATRPRPVAGGGSSNDRSQVPSSPPPRSSAATSRAGRRPASGTTPSSAATPTGSPSASGPTSRTCRCSTPTRESPASWATG